MQPPTTGRGIIFTRIPQHSLASCHSGGIIFMPHVFCGHVLGKPAGTDALPIGILPTAVAEPK